MAIVKFEGIDEISNSANGKLKLGDPLEFSQDVLMNGPIRSQAALCSNGTLDLAVSNYWVCNCTGAMTFNFTNVPTDADVISLVVELHDAGSHVLTFPAEVKWGGGAAPVFTVGNADLVGFITTDGGSNWRGMGLNFNSGVPFVDPS